MLRVARIHGRVSRRCALQRNTPCRSSTAAQSNLRVTGHTRYKTVSSRMFCNPSPRSSIIPVLFRRNRVRSQQQVPIAGRPDNSEELTSYTNNGRARDLSLFNAGGWNTLHFFFFFFSGGAIVRSCTTTGHLTESCSDGHTEYNEG